MGGALTTKHVNEAMNKGVAESRPIATKADLQQVIPTRDTLRYVQNDTYVADVSAILGHVYYENIGSDALVPFWCNVSAAVDPNSKLTAPQIVSELIVDSKLQAKAEALSFLSAGLSAEELLEVRVINNASARLVDKGAEWDAAIKKWRSDPDCKDLIDDPSVGTVSVVTGVVQKYFTTKKYKKFEASAKGGAWGVNVEGSLYTSTSQFELSVIYGLDLVTFKRAKNVKEFDKNLARGLLVKDSAGLRRVNRLFDKMAMSRNPIFPVPDGPNL